MHAFLWTYFRPGAQPLVLPRTNKKTPLAEGIRLYAKLCQ